MAFHGSLRSSTKVSPGQIYCTSTERVEVTIRGGPILARRFPPPQKKGFTPEEGGGRDRQVWAISTLWNECHISFVFPSFSSFHLDTSTPFSAIGSDDCTLHSWLHLGFSSRFGLVYQPSHQPRSTPDEAVCYSFPWNCRCCLPKRDSVATSFEKEHRGHNLQFLEIVAVHLEGYLPLFI